ncbi:hypothetical protein [Okeania sp. SIO2G5]|uniref:hypothetical protein n=1 Tax=Okeania sp. SIO2G5 TaxID=2607796 RepID=UPI0013BF10D8|nr:hypothetical protein [Okeania sp. SIO2G5]NEP76070.1 hypothetical protein [Okeania sp. SIO2G5]
MIMLTREIEFKGYKITLRLDSQLKVFIKTSEIEPFIVIRKIDFIKSIKELPEYIDTEGLEVALLLFNDSSFLSFIYDKADEFKKDVSVVECFDLKWSKKVTIQNNNEVIELYQTPEKLIYIPAEYIIPYSDECKDKHTTNTDTDTLMLWSFYIATFEDIDYEMEKFVLRVHNLFDEYCKHHQVVVV